MHQGSTSEPILNWVYPMACTLEIEPDGCRLSPRLGYSVCTIRSQVHVTLYSELLKNESCVVWYIQFSRGREETYSVVVLGLLQGGREVEAPTGHAQTLADVNIPGGGQRIEGTCYSLQTHSIKYLWFGSCM